MSASDTTIPEPPASLREASQLLASKPAEAEVLARRALKDDPHSVEAKAMLGAALRRQGAFADSIKVLAPLAADKASPWIVHLELAQAQLASGNSRGAIRPLHRALELNPGLTPGWRLLGDILMAGGAYMAAREAYDRRIRSMIRDPDLQAVVDSLIADKLPEAERALRGLLKRTTHHTVAARHLLAEVLRRRNRLPAAERTLRQCLEETPEFYQARVTLTQVLFADRRFDECIEEVDRLLARDPADSRALMIKAAALTDMARFEPAVELTDRLLDSFPDQPRIWLVQGNNLRSLGRTADAIAAYDKSIALDPTYAEAYWSLANLKTYRFTPERLATIGELLERPNLPHKSRVELGFALAKGLEDAGDDKAAFAAYLAANAAERDKRPHDPDATTRRTGEYKALFTKDLFDARLGWGDPSNQPIFIVGLPRSGSTLVEQILASHREVEGTRELPDLQIVANGVRGFPQTIGELPREAFSRLASEYLRRTLPYRNLGRPRFTDKRPGNFRFAGLIHLMLPNARIIDIRRHPMACCTSIFRQHFANGFEATYDLTHLGRFYADYVELMDHFDAVLPGHIHRVIYEDLVADTEGEIGRMLDYLGLPADPACLRFHETQRSVPTPSSEQVRLPIFDEGLDHWRRFEPWLGPLEQALGPALQSWRGSKAQTAG